MHVEARHTLPVLSASSVASSGERSCCPSCSGGAFLRAVVAAAAIPPRALRASELAESAPPRRRGPCLPCSTVGVSRSKLRPGSSATAALPEAQRSICRSGAAAVPRAAAAAAASTGLRAGRLPVPHCVLTCAAGAASTGTPSAAEEQMLLLRLHAAMGVSGRPRCLRPALAVGSAGASSGTAGRPLCRAFALSGVVLTSHNAGSGALPREVSLPPLPESPLGPLRACLGLSTAAADRERGFVPRGDWGAMAATLLAKAARRELPTGLPTAACCNSGASSTKVADACVSRVAGDAAASIAASTNRLPPLVCMRAA